MMAAGATRRRHSPDGGIQWLWKKHVGTCFGETGLKIWPDVFRHDNCEQKKHALLCKMSPTSHFFLFEKAKKKMKSVHICHEKTL